MQLNFRKKHSQLISQTGRIPSLQLNLLRSGSQSSFSCISSRHVFPSTYPIVLPVSLLPPSTTCRWLRLRKPLVVDLYSILLHATRKLTFLSHSESLGMRDMDSVNANPKGSIQHNGGDKLESAKGSRGDLGSGAGRATPLQGWRLVGVLLTLAFGLLLAVIETSITATALVSISEYFDDFIKATWVVLAYLLSYMGFAVIFTRLSDGIGRQEATIVAWVFFGAFSLGGGLARTLNQLICFRVLQGIGGSGLYSMIMVIGFEVTPMQNIGVLSGIIGVTIATGSILGRTSSIT